MSAGVNSRRFKILLAASIILAVLAFGTAVVIGHLVDAYDGARASYWFSGLWLIVSVTGLILYRKRGLWFLVGAPLALFVPIYFEIFYGGSCNGAACM